jgi:hypothetical protein
VRVQDAVLREKLIRRIPVDEAEDVALRSAVSEAIRFIAARAGVPSPMRLHYTFWNLFRSVCLRENPYCWSYPAGGTLPSRYAHLVDQGHVRRCPFAEVCQSADATDRLLEHSFDTDWY